MYYDFIHQLLATFNCSTIEELMEKYGLEFQRAGLTLEVLRNPDCFDKWLSETFPNLATCEDVDPIYGAEYLKEQTSKYAAQLKEIKRFGSIQQRDLDNRGLNSADSEDSNEIVASNFVASIIKDASKLTTEEHVYNLEHLTTQSDILFKQFRDNYFKEKVGLNAIQHFIQNQDQVAALRILPVDEKYDKSWKAQTKALFYYLYYQFKRKDDATKFVTLRSFFINYGYNKKYPWYFNSVEYKDFVLERFNVKINTWGKGAGPFEKAIEDFIEFENDFSNLYFQSKFNT